MDKTAAFIGASAACCGVVTLGRPMIRAGGYEAWARKEGVIDGGSFPPSPEEIEEEEQSRLDAVAVQIIGPALTIVGTLLNGISGFFG
ncbi:hypothetical protein IFT59_18910 [Rhizobium sp. CFBP 8752]|uniref:hypothetical protein n=1 Tax=Rhizobium sp. CFBP 8752 TaxID=2775301 RepID=UPI00178761FB|nr:hypothetical protein [Rhizobium sp. CFBP 8752]MBD8665315.1 hypothetical protein [Rhizobium sp. CFBP 8752]